jgi:hypothetical protein
LARPFWRRALDGDPLPLVLRVEQDRLFFRVDGKQYFVMRPGLVRLDRSRFGAGDIEDYKRASTLGLERSGHHEYATRK